MEVVKNRTLFFHALKGNLTITYPATVKLQFYGSGIDGYRLDIHCKPISKQVRAEVIKQLASNAGSATSAKKAKASRKNGKLGGRPKR